MSVIDVLVQQKQALQFLTMDNFCSFVSFMANDGFEWHYSIG